MRKGATFCFFQFFASLGQKISQIRRNKTIGSIETPPVAIDHPITGGNAPAAPPITMF